MSFKAVDLQFAVQKNNEAGHAQHQLMQRSAHDQALLGTEAQRTAERMRRQAAALEETSGTKIRAKNERNRDSGSGGHNRKEHTHENSVKKQEPNRASDPFKGRHVDLSL